MPTPSPFTLNPLKAALISTGTEITQGLSVDTNSAFLAQKLASLGVVPAKHVSVPDDLNLLIEALREARDNFDLSILTGGLGPTEDDLTRVAASVAFGLPLDFNPDLYAEIREYMESRGYAAPPNNARQAWLPRGATLIRNPTGTAPAFAVRTPGHLAFFLPGVPREMESLATKSVMPLVSERFAARTGATATVILRAMGLGEGRVDELLKDLVRLNYNPQIGLSAQPCETRIIVNSRAATLREAQKLAEPLIAEIEKRLGDSLAGRGEEAFEEAIAQIVAQRGYVLGIVDSLSEGLFAQKIAARLRGGALAGHVILPSARGLKAAISFLAGQGANLFFSLGAQAPARGPRLVPPPGTPARAPTDDGAVTVHSHIFLASKPARGTRAQEKRGKDFFQLTPLAGTLPALRERAAALASFQLLSFLRGESPQP
ncbi:MAG: hypothetical protein LBO66_03120 [Deltaproteobacteria bacterium]|jgi:nicotinamide-nucleotide amidase|nr:hypothetical protein [Deltaproteobacteria bacterium]